MIKTASRTTASLSDAKKRKSELHCQFKRAVEAVAAIDEAIFSARYAAVQLRNFAKLNAPYGGTAIWDFLRQPHSSAIKNCDGSHPALIRPSLPALAQRLHVAVNVNIFQPINAFFDRFCRVFVLAFHALEERPEKRK